MVSELEDIKSRFYIAKGRKIELERKKAHLEEKFENAKVRLSNAEQARAILQLVAKSTQSKLEYHIANLVTTALRSVFPEAPDFEVHFVERRNTTECDLLFKIDGEEYKPIESSGGGALDVASFALRVSRWSLNKNRPTLILDEPFRNVSPDLQNKVSEMVKLVSSEIKLQIIMISHAVEINTSADKIFLTTKEKGVSAINENNTIN
ncbi:MAG: hypothetical protein DRQ42_00585 [Gammaproteobacteria bacterium]|nr:MAG: hypothetical protein DRQ42_00585 [Gammaproteobacteria bacterium]